MKYRYLSIIFLILVLSIGAVCAQDDAGDIVAASSDDLISVDNNADVLENELGLGNSISIDDDNYNDYFYENGTILENANISDDDTIILGNINDKVFDINMPLTITSNGTTINNVLFILNEGSENSIIENLNIFCNDANNNVFTVNTANITIQNNDIEFNGAQNASDIFAIYAEFADNLNIQANNITYVGKTDGSGANSAISVSKSDGVIVERNYLNIDIPSSNVDWMTGIAQTSGVRFLSCDHLGFFENTIDLITEASVAMYPTVYIIQIKESDDVIFSANTVRANSYVDSSYLYGLSIQGADFEISSSELEMFSSTNYLCGIDVEGKSSGFVDGNVIMLNSPVVAYGVYACDWMYDGQLVNYTNNEITAESYTVYGMELLYGDESVIDYNKIKLYGNYTTGIAEMMIGGPATIINNDIDVYGTNKDMVDSGDVVPSVTVGIFSMGESQINNNAITSTGNWTVFNSGYDVNITGNYLVASELFGDDSVNDTSDSAVVENNIPIADAINYDVTNDTFFLFFNDDGFLRKNITAESLTFIGEFSGLTIWNVIDRPIKLLGDDAVLYDMSFVIGSDNVTVEDFTFISNQLAEIITVIHSNNVSIYGSEFNVQGVADDSNVVIHIISSDNVRIDLNTINFTVETNDTYKNRAILAEESHNLTLESNEIIAYLPARSVDWTTGIVYSEGVSLSDCNGAVLDDNAIGVVSNDKIGDYDTIYALHVIGDDASIVYNRISAVYAPYGYAAVITGKDFRIHENIIAVGENGSYACGINVESNSNGVIDSNKIVAVGISAYGIYTANWAGDVKANITNNNITASGNSVFGMSLSGSESLVEGSIIITDGNFTTGIASVVSDILIDGNEIHADGSNVGIPLGYDSMGIQTVGVHIVGGNATVTNNYIDSNSDYAVNMSGNGEVTENELYAEIVTGDFAVDYVPSEEIIVANNRPEMDYILTNETFFVYFKEDGYLKDQVKGDNLTFVGEFSNLVNLITINKPIKLLSDNATLNNIGIDIESDNVTVDGFSFIGEDAGISVFYSADVEIINNNFIIEGFPDDSNVAIEVAGSENVVVENNKIIFGVKTNDTFVNAAIAAEDSDNLIIKGNNITASLPARSIDWTTGKVYSQGLLLDNCNNTVLEENTVGVKSNGQMGGYDSIYAVNIKGNNVTLTKNNFGVIEAPYGYAVVISGENFNITQNMIYAGENSTYTCGIDVESNSNGVIASNLIYAIADESAYGIYTANWNGDVKTDIINNSVYVDSNSPFALSLSGSESLVRNNSILAQGNYTTGIASLVDNITIDMNKIYALGSNVGTPLGYDMMGIETTGIHIAGGNATVTNNNVSTTGEYAVDAEGTGTVSDNYLMAADYTGDAAVDVVPGDTLVMNNTPVMQRVIIQAEDIVMYYKNGTRYVVKVVDMNGNPLAGEAVTLTINGASYKRTTNENGTASMAINLPAGNYTASVEYIGTGNCTNTTIENNITVLTTVLGDDLVKIFRNASQYYATFLDGQGNPLTNGTATFNINGVMYYRKINENGTAKLNINLNPGTYIITAIHPVNGETHANNITVLSSITDNKDLVKYYRNASQYVVTVLGDDGKAVGAGETVTFNINGVFYNRTTNASGQAKLNINLNPGDYIITADYKGCKVSNNIKVLPVLTAKDLVIKYGTSDQFIARLVDGQGKPYPGQTITFNINGVMYQRITDFDGRGVLNIRLGAAKDVYIITSSYNGTSISNTITIVD